MLQSVVDKFKSIMKFLLFPLLIMANPKIYIMEKKEEQDKKNENNSKK